MKFQISVGFTAALLLSLAACYPIDHYDNRKKTTSNAQQQKQKTAEQTKREQEDALREKQREETGQAGTQSEMPRETAGPQNTTPSNTSPPSEPRRTDYPFANKVPGKDGFVFSPYNNKVVDVRDIPSGTLVQDPTYPASEKKYFRVP